MANDRFLKINPFAVRASAVGPRSATMNEPADGLAAIASGGYRKAKSSAAPSLA